MHSFCDVIPPTCVQMRNLILAAFPRNVRLPDPFTPNLKVFFSVIFFFDFNVSNPLHKKKNVLAYIPFNPNRAVVRSMIHVCSLCRSTSSLKSTTPQEFYLLTRQRWLKPTSNWNWKTSWKLDNQQVSRWSCAHAFRYSRWGRIAFNTTSRWSTQLFYIVCRFTHRRYSPQYCRWR